MPHWLQITLAISGAFVSWRWVYQPAKRAAKEVMTLLRAIRGSSEAVRELAAEQRDMAGAVVRLSVAIVEELAAQRDELSELSDRHEATTQLVVDLDADMRRLEKTVARSKGRED